MIRNNHKHGPSIAPFKYNELTMFVEHSIAFIACFNSVVSDLSTRCVVKIVIYNKSDLKQKTKEKRT